MSVVAVAPCTSYFYFFYLPCKNIGQVNLQEDYICETVISCMDLCFVSRCWKRFPVSVLLSSVYYVQWTYSLWTRSMNTWHLKDRYMTGVWDWHILKLCVSCAAFIDHWGLITEASYDVS